MDKKSALITGATGMDFCSLSRILLDKGYKVYGMARQSASTNYWRLEEEGILKDIEIIDGDLTDQSSLERVVQLTKPDEVYNLAAISFVAMSWKMPSTMMEVTGIGPIRLLEALRQFSPNSHMYQASSSEILGGAPPPQNELTKFQPRSIYGVAKCAAHHAIDVYRRSYNMYAVGGILYNHTCKYRGAEFFERKISLAAANIKHGLQNEVMVGNLKSLRDFGHSKDYMECAWLMLQQDKPKDYIIGSGETHTMEEVCDVMFSRVGLDYKQYVKVDPQFFRPAEVDLLLADASLARKELNWSPKYAFKDLMHELIDADMERVAKQIRNKDN